MLCDSLEDSIQDAPLTPPSNVQPSLVVERSIEGVLRGKTHPVVAAGIAPQRRKARTIELTQGFVALVDDADFQSLNEYKWYIKRDRRKNTNYAVMADGTRMHRFILRLPSGSVPLVDHRDLNGLNNQRDNLRVCTFAQNRSNTKKAHGSSQFKGVSRDGSQWVTYIKVNQRTKYLGTFADEVAAALAYDVAAREHFGEFARCNFPTKKPCAPCIPASIILTEMPGA